MKKVIAITFIFLAGVFCFKGIITYVAAITDSACYVLDISEKESSEKEDKDDKKSDTEEWQLGLSEDLPSLNFNYNNSFRYHKETGYYTPYLEVISPPPDLFHNSFI